jgi:hypothetical protein
VTLNTRHCHSDPNMLGPADGLPELPPFSTSLHLSGGAASAATTAMATFIRSAFVRQQAA